MEGGEGKGEKREAFGGHLSRSRLDVRKHQIDEPIFKSSQKDWLGMIIVVLKNTTNPFPFEIAH